MSHPFQSNFGTSYPPGSSSYYSSYPQFGGQQQATVPSPFSQHISSPLGPFPPYNAMNPPRYNSNAPQHNPQSFPYAAPPFPPPDMFKQFANNGLPPPANLPPTPMHFPPPQMRGSFNTSQLQQPSPQSVNPSALLSQESRIEEIEDEVDEYDPRYPQGMPQGLKLPEQESSPSKDTREQNQSGGAVHVQPSFSPFPPGLEHVADQSNLLDFFSESMRDNASANQSDILHQPSVPTLNGHVTSMNSTNNLAFGQNLSASSSQNSAFVPPLAPLQGTQVKDYLPYAASPAQTMPPKSTQELRRLAKDAVSSLMAHSILYPQLTAEGINSTILRDLYQELGVKVPQSTDDVPSEDDINPNRSPPAVAANSQPDLLPGIALSPLPEHGVTTATNVENEIKDDLARATSVEPAIATTQPPTSALNPALERKDRIAQLLAARTSRPSPSRTFPDPAQSSTAVTLDVPQVPQNTPIPADSNQSVQNPPAQANQAVKITKSNLPVTPAPSIPGLFMPPTTVSTPPNPFASSTLQQDHASAPVSNQAQKRPHDAEPLTEIRQPKRQHTLSLSNVSDAMVLDSDEDASEGEILEDVPAPQVIVSANQQQAEVQNHAGKSASNNSVTLESHSKPLSDRPPALGARTISYGDTTLSPGISGAQSANRLTSEQIAEKAQALKARFLRQRAERQKALQDGLPDLNAEVSKTQSRLTDQKASLAQIRERISSLDLDLLQARKQEEAALTDIQRLESHLREGLSGQTQYADELQNLTKGHAGSDIGIATSTTQVADAADTVQQSPVATSLLAPVEVSYSAMSNDGPQELLSVSEEYVVRQPGRASRGEELTATQPSSAEQSAASDELPDDYIMTDSARVVELNDNAGTTVNTQQVTQNHETTMTGNEMHGVTEYQAVLAVPIGEEHHEDGPNDPSQEDEGYGDEGTGSASMSDSGSDYGMDQSLNASNGTPAQPIEDENDNSDAYEPDEIELYEAEDGAINEVEDDDYEPSEQVQQLATPLSQRSEAMQGSPPTAADPRSPGHEIFHDARNDQFSPEQSQMQPETFQDPNSHFQPVALTNGGSQSGVVTIPDTLPAQFQASTETQPRPRSFTPYQSPLSAFQSFRYHPQFIDQSKQGYRSLTYSNSIDPKVPLCPTELGGETCQDPDCEEQHFSHLALTDEKILVQMSSATDIKDKAIRDEYLLGLKGIIADLRSRGVKEFESVASALSMYRRDFFSEKDASSA